MRLLAERTGLRSLGRLAMPVLEGSLERAVHLFQAGASSVVDAGAFVAGSYPIVAVLLGQVQPLAVPDLDVAMAGDELAMGALAGHRESICRLTRSLEGDERGGGDHEHDEREGEEAGAEGLRGARAVREGEMSLAQANREKVKVKLTAIDERGRLNLSMKDAQ